MKAGIELQQSLIQRKSSGRVPNEQKVISQDLMDCSLITLRDLLACPFIVFSRFKMKDTAMS